MPIADSSRPAWVQREKTAARDRPGRTIGWALLLASPALVYLVVLSASAINIPTGDDYFAIFRFLERWQEPARSGFGRLGMIFEQFYSHRIPFTRLAVVGQTALLGHCDLRLLLAFAWAGWLLLLGSLLWTRWSSRPGLLWLLPVSLLLMQPQGATNLLVATGSPGHAWTILLAFWACYLARAAARPHQGWAMLLAACASLCTANGLLVFPLVACGALFRRQWTRGLIWLAVGAAVWGAYLRGYSTAEQPYLHHAFSLQAWVVNAAVMTGAVVNFGTIAPGLVLAAGLALLLAAGLAWWRDRRDEQGSGNGAFLLFLLLSIAMTSYVRVGWSADYMLQDRYRPYGLLLITMLYLRFSEVVIPSRRTVLLVAALPAACCFNFFSYAQESTSLTFSRSWTEATAMNLVFGRPLPLPSAAEQASASGEILRTAIQHGTLRPPRLLRPEDITMIRNLPRSRPMSASVPWGCNPSTVWSGYRIEPGRGQGSDARPDFGVIFQGDNPLILPVDVTRARFAEILSRRTVLGENFGFVLPALAYAPGRFTFYAVKRLADGGITVLWSTVVTCP